MSDGTRAATGVCTAFDEDLSALLDHELSSEREAELRTHLEACAACRARLAALARVDSALRSAVSGSSRESLPAGVADRFRARLEAERAVAPAPDTSARRTPRHGPQASGPRRTRWVASALAAAAAVAFFVLVSLRAGPLAPGRPAEVARESAPDAPPPSPEPGIVARALTASGEAAPEAASAPAAAATAEAGATDSAVAKREPAPGRISPERISPERTAPAAEPAAPPGGAGDALADVTDEEIALALDLETVEDLEVIAILDALEGSG